MGILNYNAIGSEGLLAVLKNVPAEIEVLGAQGTEADDAADGVATELPRLKRLRVLNLSFNNFGDHGVEAIARQIPHSVQDLQLSNTGFKQRGAMALAPHLSHLRRL